MRLQHQAECFFPGPALASFNVFEAISNYDPERTLKRFSVKCEGTTTWILSDPKFREWLVNMPPQSFLLSGIGKNFYMYP